MIEGFKTNLEAFSGEIPFLKYYLFAQFPLTSIETQQALALLRRRRLVSVKTKGEVNVADVHKFRSDIDETSQLLLVHLFSFFFTGEALSFRRSHHARC